MTMPAKLSFSIPMHSPAAAVYKTARQHGHQVQKHDRLWNVTHIALFSVEEKYRITLERITHDE